MAGVTGEPLPGLADRQLHPPVRQFGRARRQAADQAQPLG